MHALRPLLTAALALGLLGCTALGAETAGGGSESRAKEWGSGEALESILARGTLRVALSGDQPPFNMRNRDGDLMGLDVDLARALADAMGLELELRAMPFAEMLPALEAASVDLVISALSITPRRNARVPFAGPYYVSGTAALSKSDPIAQGAAAETLNVAGRRYAAVAGTTNETFAREHLPRAEVVATRDFDAAVALVVGDQVDAVLADFPLCKYAAMRHPEAGLSQEMTPFTVEPLGVAVRADAPRLVNLVQNYLDTLEYAGLLASLKARWLGDDAWLEDMP